MALDLYDGSRFVYQTPEQICKIINYVLDINKNDDVLDIGSAFGNYLINVHNCNEYKSLNGIEINVKLSLISKIRLMAANAVYNIETGNLFKDSNNKPTKDIIKIKNNYLHQINVLFDELNSNQIKSRTAYNRLSILIRKFIKETTEIDLLKSSLSEIKKKDTGILYDLIKEYYEPEFSKNNKGDIISSINKTRKVIEEWK